MKLILIAVALALTACAEPAKVEHRPSTEYYVNDQWLACTPVTPANPQCGASLNCNGAQYDCLRQLMSRGETK